MPDPRHEQLRRLFDQALELPTVERPSFLDRQCRGDEALRQRLLAMLAAAEDARFLATPTGDVPGLPAGSDDTVEALLREGPGTRIGPYKLLQRIGEGGFGVVFLAEQERPVVRKVALKIIKLGMDTRQVVARFEQERQALAMMDHPNIARVLDAGATETGRPYFVMDLVKGAPIADYCDQNHLTIAERLELSAQVCTAVQHAHGKGIIHRDLKPSNILVGTQDGRPTAKVIDFGIAKATSQKLTDKTLFTEHQQVIGTLQYMSPEQAEGSLDIDTRTDVYSLGVLLYELLTGSTPFDQKTLRNALYGELQRLIREVEPPRPSTRLSDSHETLASIAAHRRTEPKRLGTILRGDLDWIVMKALEKDRARRYETANGLAMDIRRHLAGEAVVAAPPSASYRLRKVLRRHRGTFTAAAAVAIALLVGVVGFAWQASVASEQRDRALAAEAETGKRADELTLVAEFQAGMLQQIDPTRAGQELTANVTARFATALAKSGAPEAEQAERVEAFRRQWSFVNATDAARELIDATILKPAIAAIDQQFRGQPAVDAQLRQTLAIRYRELGLYDAALPLQTSALATRRRVLGEDHPDTLHSIQEMGGLLMAHGKFAEAEPFHLEALAKRRATLGEDHRDTLTSIHDLGMLLEAQGKRTRAEPLLREALAKRRRVLGDDHPETLVAINDVGFLLSNQGDVEGALPYYVESLERSRRVLGEDHKDTLISINNMGYLLQAQGKHAEAEPFFRESLVKRRRVLGEDHPNTLTSINNMGMLLQAMNRLDEAEPLLREALAKRRLVLGDDHPITLGAINNMALLLHTQGRLEQAEPLYRESMERTLRVFGGDYPETLRRTGNLGALFVEQGRHADAITLLAPIEPTARAVFQGPQERLLALLLKHLGKARTGAAKSAADFAAAAGNLLEAHALIVKVRGEGHKDTRDFVLALVRCYGAWDEAEPGAEHGAQRALWQAKLDALPAPAVKGGSGK